MLEISEQAVRDPMPLFADRFIFHARGQISNALGGHLQVFLSHWLCFESVATIITSRLSLCPLRKLADYLYLPLTPETPMTYSTLA